MPLDLLSATPLSASEIEIAFSALPRATGSGANDALLPGNYLLAGARSVRVVEIVEVLTDLAKFRLVVAPALTAGSWTLTVQNVETARGEVLGTATATFTSAGPQPVTSRRRQGQETGYSIISQCLSPAFQGGAWEPMKKAIGWVAQKNIDYGAWASDQLFLESAGGRWLDRRSLENNLPRPAKTGISDVLFRRLAEAWVWGKLTGPGLWAMLDVFYGPELTRAVAVAELPEPYDLSGGEELWVSDGELTTTLIVDGDILSTPGAATALSVAASLNYQVEALRLGLYADTVTTDDGTFLRLVSREIGSEARLIFSGGSAQTVLRFPFRVLAHDAGAGVLPTWTVALVHADAAVTFTCSDPTGTSLSLVQPDDYAVVSGAEFLAANRGTFTVLDVQVTGAIGSRTQIVKLANRAGSAQVGVVQVAEKSLLFFRPDPVLQDSAGPTISQARGRLDVALPVGTNVVARDLSTAGYLRDWTFVGATAERLDTTVTITTASAHGLSAGQLVELVEPVLDYTEVTTTAGSSGVSDSSPLTVWSDLDPMADPRQDHGAAQLQSGDVLVACGYDGASYLNTAQRFRVTSDVTAADGRRTLGYSWVATANAPDALSRHTLTFSPYTGLAFLAGGYDGASSLDSLFFYDEATNSWGTLAPMLIDRYNHAAVVVGPKLFVIGGFNTGGSVRLSGSEYYDTAAGAWALGPAMTLNRERLAAIVYELDGTNYILICGGIDENGEPMTNSETVDADALPSEFTRAGAMAWARYGHRLVALGDGRILAVGGYGRRSSEVSVTPAPISEVEVFDTRTRTWSSAGDLQTVMAEGVVVLVGDRVFAGMGGMAHAARRDSATGLWLRSAGAPDISPVGPAYAGNDWVLACGGVISSSPTDEARLLIPNRELYAGPTLPDFAWVATIVSPTVFTIEQPGIAPNVSVWSGLSVGARPYDGSWLGPYLFSPFSGMLAGSEETTLAQDIEVGQQYTEIEVAAPLDTSVEWIGVDVNGDTESGPVRYLGLGSSSTKMRIDYEYIWPFDVPSGTVVSGLVQMAPYQPSAQEHVAYLAPSDAAVVAARGIVEEATAAGYERHVDIRYTSDLGMGAEGYPTSGDGKLSDLPGVWSGD